MKNNIENGNKLPSQCYWFSGRCSRIQCYRLFPINTIWKQKEEKHKKVENEFGAKDQQKPLRMSTNKLMRNYEKGFKGQEKPNKI